MSDRYDVIVVGMGSTGSAACLELARRGLRVLGLEQHGIPHTLGSFHGDSRLIRLCYYEHPDYVPLLLRAYERWAMLESETGLSIMTLTGAIYVGPADGPLIRGGLRSAREHALPHESIDADEIARRFPLIHPEPGHAGLYEPRGGFLRPELAVAACTKQSLRHGADVHGMEPVRAWRAEGDGVVVETDRASYAAGRLVVCGGAWAGSLLAALGLPLTVTRQVLGWVWPRRPAAFEIGAFPCWAVETDETSLLYGFPMLEASPGLKVGMHALGQPGTADTIDRTTRPEDEQTFMPALRARLPDAAGPVLSMRVCMYTNTPDGHFVIDRHPEHPQVCFACGFSGHGFKFSSVIGEVMADLAVDGATALPIEFLGLARFANV